MTDEALPVPLQDTDSGYNPFKPEASRLQEQRIKQTLLDQGVPVAIADAVIGYEPGQVPFVYRNQPHRVEDGSNGGELISELWIGTSAPATQIFEARWRDQIPEVIMQWRGHVRVGNEDAGKKVTRTEIHHIADGSFVELTYAGVSDMGQFDGEVSAISINTPHEVFHPYGGPKPRQSYRISYIRPRGAYLTDRDTDPEWILNDRMNVTGTTLHNGLDQLIQFDLAEMTAVKEDFERAYRFSHTAIDDPTAPLAIESGDISEAAEAVEKYRPRIQTLMEAIAPEVAQVLAGNYEPVTARQMVINGILDHPDIIEILGTKLSVLESEQRFRLAILVARELKSGNFTQWIRDVIESQRTGIMRDVAIRNTNYVLDLFVRNYGRIDVPNWIEAAQESAERLKREGSTDHLSSQFVRCWEGMMSSFVERYLEHLAQIYLQNTLSEARPLENALEE